MEAKEMTKFSVGQKVRRKNEAWENQRWDYLDAALVPLMGRGPHQIIKVIEQEGGRQDVFLDIEGYKHVPCNSLSLEFADIPNMVTKLIAPTSKTRVVGVDLFDHSDYLVGDYDSCDEAFRVADGHNTKRPGSMDDVYYVYDDKGRYIRGNEAVGQKSAHSWPTGTWSSLSSVETRTASPRVLHPTVKLSRPTAQPARISAVFFIFSSDFLSINPNQIF